MADPAVAVRLFSCGGLSRGPAGKEIGVVCSTGVVEEFYSRKHGRHFCAKKILVGFHDLPVRLRDANFIANDQDLRARTNTIQRAIDNYSLRKKSAARA